MTIIECLLVGFIAVIAYKIGYTQSQRENKKKIAEVVETQKKAVEACGKCAKITDCPIFYPWLKREK